jgi:long-chain acyl-CoA synthetase
LVNRRLDLIVVNGFSVYPHEVESVLTSIDGVHEAAVVGIPNEQTGEAVRALVVVAPDSGLDSDQIVAQCAARLARFKLPTIVEFVDALPRLSNGQFARQSLREWS